MFLEVLQSPVFASPGSNAVSGHYHIPGQLPGALAGFSCPLCIVQFLPCCWEVLLAVCLLSVLAVPVCRGGHICLGHNSLILDFFSLSVLEGLVTFIHGTVIFAQLPGCRFGNMLCWTIVFSVASHCLKPSQILLSVCS